MGEILSMIVKQEKQHKNNTYGTRTIPVTQTHFELFV